MKTREKWKAVVGFEERYEVSNLGRVRATFDGNHGQFKSGRIKLQEAHQNHYLFVGLYRPGNGTRGQAGSVGKYEIRSIHSLMLEAFVGPRPTPQHECRHLDGVRRNNVLSNLKWGTKLENRDDSRRHGTLTNGSRNGFSKLKEADILEIFKLRASGMVYTKIGPLFKVHWSTVWLIIKGKTWKHVKRPT